MSFSVELPSDQFTVEAGSTTPASISIKNTGEELLQVEIFVEGIDGEWYMIPVPVLTVEPGATQSEKIFLKPPRVSESLAGTYPFVVRVRSLETGEAKSCQGAVTVKPYHYLTMEVSPKRGKFSKMSLDNVFTATVLNLGNSEHTLQMFGNDAEDQLSYTFDAEQVTIGPGQTRSIEATVVPIKHRPFSSVRLHGFSIGSRSLQTPTAVASANAQLEERPVITPASLMLLFFIAALAMAWVLALPKPPSLDSFRVEPKVITDGEPVKLLWRASNADGIRVTLDGEQILESSEASGEITISPAKGGIVDAVAMRGSKRSESKRIELTVNPKPIIPAPTITTFTASPDPVNLGERIEIRYKVGDSVTRLVLLPQQVELDPKLETKWIDASAEGTLKFTLRAFNSEGKTVEKTRDVTVVDPSRPKISTFAVDKTTFEEAPTMVTVRWSALNASTITLEAAGEKITIFEPTGTRDYTIEKSTGFTLTVTDSKGRSVTRRINVTYKPPIEPDPPSRTGPGSPSGDPSNSTGPPEGNE